MAAAHVKLPQPIHGNAQLHQRQHQIGHDGLDTAGFCAVLVQLGHPALQKRAEEAWSLQRFDLLSFYSYVLDLIFDFKGIVSQDFVDFILLLH